ncbi:MAG: RidA family protein [Sphingobacteriaceae bacterium]|nr:RidA family protein [Sphingobacteriaceae bacterium]
MYKVLSFLILSFSLSSVFAQKKVIYSDKAPKPIGPYSQAIQNGNTLYVSGQIAIRADGTMDTSSIENETKLVMENLKAVLAAAELNFNHVLKTTIYMTDLKKFKTMNEVYGRYFTSDPPARETVEVKALPKGAHIEISVIAKNNK